MSHTKNTSLTKKLCALALIATISPLAYSASPETPATNASADTVDVADQIKQTSKGIGRFRTGLYISAGYQGATNSGVSPKIQGFLIDAGGYVLVNPIKKFADIEIGVSGKYNTGMSTTSKNNVSKYYNGFSQVSAYAGPVFQIGGGKHAIGIGLSKAFVLNEVKGDSKDKSPKNKLSNGLGAYIEYQWVGEKGKDNRHTIPFARFSVEQFDLKSAMTNKTSKQTVFGLVGGVKY